MVDFVSVPVDDLDPIARAFEDGASSGDDEPTTPKRGRGRPRGTGSRRGKAAGADQLGTLAVTGFVLLVAFTIGDWASPTEAEANAISVPLGNILARRIDLASKLGKDADDVVLLTIGIVTWLSRVGPEGVNRGREAYAERQRRVAASRVDRSSIIRDDTRTTGVDARSDDQFGSGSPDGASRAAFALDAQARDAFGNGLGSDPRFTPNFGNPLAR